jgi:ankyrin repeat protein
MLVDVGVPVGEQDAVGQTVVHASVGSTPCVIEALRAAGAADIVNLADAEGFSALHYAVSNREHEAASALLGVEGVDTDPKDAEDRTPLHWSCAIGDAEMTRTLLDVGATATAEDSEGLTPLAYAARADFVDCVHVLAEHDASVAEQRDREGLTPLMQSAGTGSNAAIDALLALESAPTFVNAVGNDGRNAVLLAAIAQNADGVVKVRLASQYLLSLASRHLALSG